MIFFLAAATVLGLLWTTLYLLFVVCCLVTVRSDESLNHSVRKEKVSGLRAL